MMMIAAPDTTSALICSLVNNILRNPRVHRALVSEIASASAAGRLASPVATFAQISALPYFTACVQEAARLCPSIPVLIPRRVSAGGCVLDGRFVPAGATVGASAAVTNLDRRVFGDDATDFRPERWLAGPPERVALMRRLTFSWGFGSRKCMGKNLALLETYKFCLQVSSLLCCSTALWLCCCCCSWVAVTRLLLLGCLYYYGCCVRAEQ